MGRVVIATVLGAVVLFAWGMAAWMALPLHAGSMKKMSDETAVASYLRQQGLKTGMYHYPMPRKTGESPKDRAGAFAEFVKKHKAGPVISIFFTSEGSEPMAPPVLVGGFVINLIAVFIAAVLLRLAARGRMSYLQRVGCVMLMGVFAAVIGHGALWNWMAFDLDWTLPMMIDMAVGWTLVGFVLAAIIQANFVVACSGDVKTVTMSGTIPRCEP